EPGQRDARRVRVCLEELTGRSQRFHAAVVPVPRALQVLDEVPDPFPSIAAEIEPRGGIHAGIVGPEQFRDQTVPLATALLEWDDERSVDCHDGGLLPDVLVEDLDNLAVRSEARHALR